MCGIGGFWFSNHARFDEVVKHSISMKNTLNHRGPDDSGIWTRKDLGLGLCHTRLSILDLSASGHQPMVSRSGRTVISFNGEMFNYREVRESLIKEGCSFRSDSDTEVILEACEKWGVEATTKSMIGMFAFALWDNQKNQMFLVRDRIGIKPLYYGQFKDGIFFGSELKAIKTFTDDLSIDSYGAELFFRYGYIPEPYCIYKNIYKLLPGSILKLENPKIISEPKKFWDIGHFLKPERERSNLSEKGAIERLNTLLKDSVKLRMISDVPIGAFLSGGVDSSVVVALMQNQSSIPIKTFTISFDENKYNEGEYAKKVAQHLGTDHKELRVAAKDAIQIIPELPWFYDEPFADSSQIPTLLLSRLTREHVTVSLSGDGGDELFGGYSHYHQVVARWKIVKHLVKLPLVRKGAESLGFFLQNNAFDKLVGKLPYMLNSGTARSIENLYEMMLSHQKPGDRLLIKSHGPDIKSENNILENDFEKLMLFDFRHYLPGDVLSKVDRASMAFALEARVPLLDHRVVEFVWQLPVNLKLRPNSPKYLLKQVLQKYVPESLYERPKMGFRIPIEEWLRGELREWAEELLNERDIKRFGFLNYDYVETIWSEHLRGISHEKILWDILMFQAWCKKWL